MRPHSINRCDLLSYLQIRHLRADLDDLASGLVANNVRLAKQCAMPAIECVASFDTYRLNANYHTFRMTLGIGDLLILENFRTAILIVDRSLHDALLTRRSPNRLCS